jgi:CheY-like chemotaxis protein
MEENSLRGRKVFIVEDEMMVAMLIEDMLGDLGCETIGPAGRIEEALATAQEAAMDAAVLDVNLNGHETYPVADILRRRGVPFIFATGYGAAGLAERFRDAPTLQKPFQERDIARLLAQILEPQA